MKQLTISLLGACCLLLAAPAAFGQLMLGGQASYLTGDDQNLWGGGAQIKLLVGQRIAIGATVRSYPKSYDERPIGGTNPGTIRTANTITPVLGTLEYYFGKDNGIQPYIGADAGLYLHRVFTEINSGNTLVLDTDEGQTYFGIAPKFGLLFKTGALIAPFVQAQYHANFGSGEGDDITVPGITNPIKTEIANSFATFDAGIIIRLRAAGK
ncbi:hypothetical protein SAMN05444008_107111 [Cnuella takakiae]|uniref:Outer membrane protein beta-barrel domain-containing protein n=1 Tax=Cnuella takakiae TaxID=1302690 RepID=A0A1M5B2H0_9BACT|nr:hypothetical protein [Cnuella takakiae]OLY93310.1 hypothetical protein BUE76_16530 [Cnuella takakiae]SHF36751.1 hypothetical protein SAMN05444008_107111 [Cnuella takakiae]